MILALFLALVAVFVMLRLLLMFATFALPLWLAVIIAEAVDGAGGGWFGAGLAGALAATAALIVGRLLLSHDRPAVRMVTVALFSVPAGIAGFHAVHGIAGIANMADGWRMTLAAIAAAATAWLAAARLADPNSAQPAGRSLSRRSGA